MNVFFPLDFLDSNQYALKPWFTRFVFAKLKAIQLIAGLTSSETHEHEFRSIAHVKQNNQSYCHQGSNEDIQL